MKSSALVPRANSYRNVKNIRFRYKKFADIKFVVIFAQNMYVHKLNLKKTKFMNKMIMNRLTMLAVTLMASMACFAQGKFTTGGPVGGLGKDGIVNFMGVKYVITQDPTEGVAVYNVKAVGFEQALLDDISQMDTKLGKTITIQHYLAPDHYAWGFLVESVEANAFQTVPTDLAAKINKLVIDYKGDEEEVIEKGGANGVVLPTTGSTFAGMTRLTEVENITPGAKVADISASSFATTVYQKVLTVPTDNMGKYATKTGWMNFEKIQDTTGHLLGNLNSDKKITTADLSLLVNAVIEENIKPTNSLFPYYNMNGDSKITTADISILVDILNRD